MQVDATTTTQTIYPIAIIGCGAAGTMAALRANLNNCETLLFTGAKKEMKRSRGHWVRKVENVPGLEDYDRTIVQLREKTLTRIENSEFAKKLHVVKDSVTTITKQDHCFTIQDKSGITYLARHVILATGIMDEQPHINGSIDPILPFANKQLIDYCILCDGHKSHNKKVAIIGHSEDAAKTALVLTNRYKETQLTLLTNGTKPTITEETRARLLERKIKVIESPITGIVGNKKERILNGFTLDSGELVDATLGFVSLGVRPNNAFALALGASVDPKGYVVTDKDGESTVPNLYVVGDLRANSMKQIYTAWQHAVEVVRLIDRRIHAAQ